MKIQLFDLAEFVLSLPKESKRLVAVCFDISFSILSVWFAFYLRLGEVVGFSGPLMWPVVVAIALSLPIFVRFGLYRAIFRYNDLPAILALANAVAAYGLLYSSLFTLIGVDGVPRTVGIIQPILLFLLTAISRVIARLWLGGGYRRRLEVGSRRRVMIFGAGDAGRQLANVIANSEEMRVVGFLDDDDRLHGRVLNGKPIYKPHHLENLVSRLDISDLLLAIPQLSSKRRNEILNLAASLKVAVRNLPSLSDLAKGKVRISDFGDLDIDELLGRDPVQPNHTLMGMNLVDKVVMVTGAGGSIGSELCRQIVDFNPSKLLLIDQSEFSLYSIHHELEERLADRKTILVPLLLSVKDKVRTSEIMSIWRPDTVYHAAAYKHVHMVECNPVEGIKNNLFGTLNTAQAAEENGVSDFVLISTDKAVRPTNIMGASKRLSEMVLQAMSAGGSLTNFSMVRFGNVLDSSGSVVPKFRQQIRNGGPVTLTAPEVTRYFMTIREAAQLVIQAGAMAKGGDVFLLDMGAPVKIIDLATRMIELSGLVIKDEERPDGDIEIKITGLLPGEKLYEELLLGETSEGTIHPKVFRANEEFLPLQSLEGELEILEKALGASDVEVIQLIMQKLVTGYTPHDRLANG